MVIDVRTPDEYADGHIKGATNIDFNSDAFANDITKLDKNGTYTLCTAIPATVRVRH